ncbi:MAG: hypothetical protein Q8P46_04980 [Hyphomicrobiales bacterium]|nr:hypothetical protein [Hyphomicrobiales bacterium]
MTSASCSLYGVFFNNKPWATMMNTKSLSRDDIERQIAELQQVLVEKDREEEELRQAEGAAEVIERRRRMKEDLLWLQENDATLPKEWKDIDSRKMPRVTTTLKRLAEKAGQAKGMGGRTKEG